LLKRVNFVKIYSCDIFWSHLFGFIKVALDSSSNATPIKAKSNEEQPAKPSAEPSSVLATQESISQFITQVSSLVK